MHSVRGCARECDGFQGVLPIIGEEDCAWCNEGFLSVNIINYPASTT